MASLTAASAAPRWPSATRRLARLTTVRALDRRGPFRTRRRSDTLCDLALGNFLDLLDSGALDVEINLGGYAQHALDAIQFGEQAAHLIYAVSVTIIAPNEV